MYYLYVIAAESAPAKVGITGNLEVRVKSVSQSIPIRGLRLWSARSFPNADAARWVERSIHEQLAAVRICGEWFDVPPENAVILAESTPSNPLYEISHQPKLTVLRRNDLEMVQATVAAEGSISAAARKLGIHRRTAQRILRLG